MSTYRNTLEAIYGPELLSIIREMNDCFPNHHPEPDQSHATIMFKAGQRSAYEWLVNRIQQEN